jgi:hypothetical protein
MWWTYKKQIVQKEGTTMSLDDTTNNLKNGLGIRNDGIIFLGPIFHNYRIFIHVNPLHSKVYDLKCLLE